MVNMIAAYELVTKAILMIGGDRALTLFSFPKAMLNLLGFDWFEGGVGLPLPNFIKHTFYRLTYPTWMIIVTILTLTHILEHPVVTQNDFIHEINGFIVSMTFSAAAFKVLIFNAQKSLFKDLYLTIEQLGPLDAESPTLKRHFHISLAYAALVFSNAGTWSAWWLLVHNEVPFSTAYPWRSEGPLFMFTIIGDFFSAVFCALSHILVDTTFQAVVVGIIAHVDNLSVSLSRLGRDRFKNKMIMSAAVAKHAKLLAAAQYLSDCYSNLFVAQSVYTVGHSCVLLFGAVNVNNKVEVVMNQGTMLMTSYMQLLIYCYYGELLTSKFNSLLFASYDNEWYDCQLRVKKSLCNFSLMCHRHVSLRGFGKVQPSKSNWLHSLQESVSYFLFLKTMTGEK